ncbi:hypothetical protein QAD02_011778 [Eretmocerus hayati]|uniref:Uncharacterized protein n=1 Tax=Eretmocerus hayati TaxID=131215 RepID=A0ACC2NXZ3_9HYME|nr:hypothetical protein QAD02_011778 [Eretmocerus hayati]
MVRKLHAPPIIDPHVKELVLHCDYDLHGNELYSVSWYRNDQMLFKYQPSSSPPGIDFQTDSDNQYSPRDVKVLPNKSNATHLLLEGNQDISQENLPRYEGTYTCEVLIERTFLADFAMANVSAAILPKSYPMIEGLSSTYQESAQLDATCSSAPSWPPADLTFLVNGQKVDRKFTREKRVQPAGAIASSSQLTISIPLERYDFPKGELRIVCRATLPGLSTEYKYEREYTAKFEEVDNQRFAQELPSLLSAGFRPTPTFLSLLCVVFSQSMLRNHLGSSWLVIRAESL